MSRKASGDSMPAGRPCSHRPRALFKGAAHTFTRVAPEQATVSEALLMQGARCPLTRLSVRCRAIPADPSRARLLRPLRCVRRLAAHIVKELTQHDVSKRSGFRASDNLTGFAANWSCYGHDAVLNGVGAA
jgi:hypothetical protein